MSKIYLVSRELLINAWDYPENQSGSDEALACFTNRADAEKYIEKYNDPHMDMDGIESYDMEIKEVSLDDFIPPKDFHGDRIGYGIYDLGEDGEGRFETHFTWSESEQRMIPHPDYNNKHLFELKFLRIATKDDMDIKKYYFK